MHSECAVLYVAECRLSIVSPLFRSAAETDVLWERLLPRDHQSILSVSDSPLLISSKKQLNLSLCGNPILIEDGKKHTRTFRWHAERQSRWRYRSPRRPIIGSSAAESNGNYPKERGDGWSEIEMGVLTKEGEEEELETWVDCRRD
ncbi:hypothetical protein NC651_038027 [Populus alba x Populus x berolinensis]|nr:hypothetical protein NC651_038027 [Populus alba x Populus x berolinensis]